MKTNKGFSLVELIVVIAIMAIIAGVAVAVYSGYIENAKQAADEQLLSAINGSFSVACQENGVSPFEFDEETAIITIDNSKADDGNDATYVTTLSVTHAKSAAIVASFNKNMETKGLNQKWQHFTSVEFSQAVGRFVTPLSVVISGKTYTYKQSQVDAYQSSNYSSVQPAELTSSVDSLSAALSGNKGGLAALANTASFNSTLVSLGIIESGTTLTASDLNDADLAKQIANASVLYVAKTVDGLDPDDVYDAFVNGNVDSLVAGSGVDSTFVTAALEYGLLTAFVNTPNGAEYKSGFVADSANVHGLTDVTSLFNKYTNNEDLGTYYDYQDYLNSDAAANDIKGFLSALAVINENADNFDLSSDYSNPAIVAAMNSILGNG